MTEERQEKEETITENNSADTGNNEDEDDLDEEGELDQGPTGSFISPEAVLMFPLAILLDLAGLVLLVFGLDDFGVTDIIGLVMIGGWTYFRSQQLKATRGAQQRVGKMAKRIRKIKRLRPLLMLGEFIPYVGAFPCWTILVFFELKS